jgi:hypothetical protein
LEPFDYAVHQTTRIPYLIYKNNNNNNNKKKSDSIRTTNKVEVEPAPEISCTLNIPQMVDGFQHNWFVIILRGNDRVRSYPY